MHFGCLLIVLVLSVFSCTADSGSPDPVTWNLQFDLPGGEHIMEVPSGGYVVAGYRHVLRLEAGGNPLWSLAIDGQLGSNSNFRVFDMTDAHNGGYLILGFDGGPEEEMERLMVVKLNDSGEIEFDKIIADGIFEPKVSISKTGEGFAAVAATVIMPGQLLLKRYELDGSGNIVSENDFGLEEETEIQLAAFSDLSGNEGYIVMTRKNPIQGGDSETGAIIKIDGQFNEEWRLPLEITEFVEVRSIVQTDDGGYLFAGTFQSNGWIFKIGPEGSKQWEETYGTDSNGRRFIWDAVIAPEGGYVFAGKNSGKGLGDFDVWLLKTDDSGQLLWDRVHGTVGYDDARALTLTSDGGYALAGAQQASGTSDLKLLVMKLDEDGELN
ncbi:MAG: hypothetical protein R3281_17930 [Balneolaceae bacterium]|nr:hypothetical protein [Balneolaceae bacterium]